MRSPDPEQLPSLARACVDRVKVLPGVEVHGDRGGDLEAAIATVLRACLVERRELMDAFLWGRGCKASHGSSLA